MKAFEANFDTIVWRYYLMMVLVIVPFFLGVPFLSLLAVPMFLFAILGFSLKKETKIKSTKERKLISPDTTVKLSEAS